MTIRDRILQDLIWDKTREMKINLVKNLNQQIVNMIEKGYSESSFQDYLKLRDEVIQMNIEEFLDFEIDEVPLFYLYKDCI